MYISGKLLPGDSDLTEVFQIYQKVFVKELNLPEEQILIALDSYAIYAIAYEDVTAVATGRLIFDGDICRIEGVAVLKEYRRKKYGDFIVRMLLNRAFSHGINTVLVKTQTSLEEFYQQIGFERVGSYFMENDIEQCKMVIKDYEMIKMCDKK